MNSKDDQTIDGIVGQLSQYCNGLLWMYFVRHNDERLNAQFTGPCSKITRTSSRIKEKNKDKGVYEEAHKPVSDKETSYKAWSWENRKAP